MPLVDDIPGLRRILARARTIAVVGLSANWYRPSYFAAKYLQDHGYRVIPVNPNYEQVLGERCYPSVSAIPEAVDVVDAFRRSEEMVELAREAVAKNASVLWMQLGIRNEEAMRIANDAGLEVVVDRCMKIEHARILGGLNWAGVNTGVISARRGMAGEASITPPLVPPGLDGEMRAGRLQPRDDSSRFPGPRRRTGSSARPTT